MLSFVAWVTDDDLNFTSMFPEAVFFDTAYGNIVERIPLYVGAGNCNNIMNFTVFLAFMPSEREWVWMYFYESALPDLLGNEVIYRIKQINTDGDRNIYELLTNLSLDENSPWYGVKHCICAYHKSDKLFKTKVSVRGNNKAFVEYAKRWIMTWCNSMDTEEEYRDSYQNFLSFMDNDLSKQGLGHAHAQILDEYNRVLSPKGTSYGKIFKYVHNIL
jgi:hypothetical protein